MTTTLTPVRGMSGADLLAAGLTMRQLTYWCDRRFIRADNPNPGSGRALWFNPAEARIALTMEKLVAAGFGATAAARIARDRAEGADVLRRLLDLVETPDQGRAKDSAP